MKTNNFRVREKKEKRIIIEEERTKNFLLAFLSRYKNFFMLLLITLLVCTLLASVGIAFSLFRGSNDYDITYISGSDVIDAVDDPDVDDEDIKEELLGEVAREEGVVILVETFMSNQGDVVSYYTDGTAVVVQSNGNIFRVSPLKNGNYGVNKNGKIDDSAKKVLVTSSTSTLSDGTVITYYSDGSASVKMLEETVFVRDSNNIKLQNGNSFSHISPSGVSLSKEIKKVNNDSVITFSDGTVLVISNNKKTIINKNVGVSVDDSGVTYDKNNSFSVIGEQTLKDGNIVTHYSNGAATITGTDGSVIYVNKSGDILLKNQKIYEIITNEYGYSRGGVNCSDGKKVIYFDNGAAVIVRPDGTRQYVEDSSEIVYDSSKNISSSPIVFSQSSQRKTTDGDTVFNFENGKSQVIKSDGTSYIVDTSKLKFSSDGTIANDPKDLEKNKDKKENKEEEEDAGEGIYISEAENKYNDKKNIEDTTFIIRNDNNKGKRLRIAIEENSSNFQKLDPRFVKFQATIGDEYIPVKNLTSNTWKQSSDKISYIIYEGKLDAKKTVTVALSLYIDYEDLTNLYQDTSFVGTIKIYVDG